MAEFWGGKTDEEIHIAMCSRRSESFLIPSAWSPRSQNILAVTYGWTLIGALRIAMAPQTVVVYNICGLQ